MKKNKIYILRMFITIMFLMSILWIKDSFYYNTNANSINDKLHLMHKNIILNEKLDNNVIEIANLNAKINKLNNEKRLIMKIIPLYPTLSPINTIEFIGVSSEFGIRIHPITKLLSFHSGIDIVALLNTPIHSTAHGEVIEVIRSDVGYGNYIKIMHHNNIETLYAHLKSIKVKVGELVDANQIIGTVGNTGRSTGPHLHYEIIENGILTNPLNYFRVPINKYTPKLLALK